MEVQQIQQEIKPQTHQNVMELLVEDEIEKQLQLYSDSKKKSINRIEVATYALNRLPPLYASSEKGKTQQKISGKQKFREQIKLAVRQGLAAVERDPLRLSTPIISEYKLAQASLEKLENLLREKQLLDHHKLSWDNLDVVVQRALKKIVWMRMKQEAKV